MVVALGGVCVGCGSGDRLEFDHVVGCTWVQRKLNRTDRIFKFFKEWKTGVQLRLLCRSCNAKHQPKRGRHLDVR